MMINILKLSSKSYFSSLIREKFHFKQYLGLLKKLQDEGEEFRKEYQLSALQNIAVHAYKNIPFWHNRFNEFDLNPDRISSIEDLKRLPLLCKKDILVHFHDLISRKSIKALLSKGQTSGTTGTPAVFYRDYRAINFENAMLWHLRHQAGVKRGERMLVLRGDIIIPASQRTPPFWLRDFGAKSLKISAYHLTSRYQLHILDAIEKFQPSCAFTYPSSVFTLSHWCNKLDRPLPFTHLHTSSETILDNQRELVTKLLKGNWLDHYGQAERLNCFAALNDQPYYDYTEYGITELIPTDDNQFEIVGSSLHNYAMPLFRYCTGDIIQERVDNGNNRPIILGLAGRKEDTILLPDGSQVGRLGIIFKGMRNIIEGQIHQLDNNTIILKIVPDKRFGTKDEKKLLTKTRKTLGNEIGIRIEYLKKIPRTKNGKFKFITSDLVKFP